MARSRNERGRLSGGLLFLLILGILALTFARTLAGWLLDYQWWKEIGQTSTWISMLIYGSGPALLACVIAFAVFWIAHARGMKSAGARLLENRTYARISTLVILLIAIFLGSASVDSWTVVRFFGGRGINDPSQWRDPVFGHPLSFYLFELPFYSAMLHVLLAVCIAGMLIYWITGHLWNLRSRFPQMAAGDINLEMTGATLTKAFESVFLRGMLSVLLLAIAGYFLLSRYDLLLTDHGFMTGADWVAVTIRLPFAWLSAAAAILAAALIWTKARRVAALLILVPVIGGIVPSVINALYVRPNEITIQKPYIQQHIEATRAAYGLGRHTTERVFPARVEAPIDVQKNRILLDNVRLWDWRAFHDTVSQVQPLRPYTFSDTDVDRYTIEGQLRQLLLSPRELDLNQLGDARSRWINPHFVYTHGYGLVLAEANRITPNGLPHLLIKDAPPVVTESSLKLSRPELYYGQEVHEPVFVRTEQPEFNYPSGSENVHTKYEGTGGFVMSGPLTKIAAAVVYGDFNIVLTNQLTSQSRMMIHRNVLERLRTAAAFINWDSDPYLVIAADGRLFWIVDGYLTSNAHPYSHRVSTRGIGAFNYIRNSVKATIDAYNGTLRLYVFDETDPIIRSYRNLLPDLFSPMSSMPADLRAHARFPEVLFRAQAEIYRTYHMRDPEAFYNKADLWDIARWVKGQESKPEPLDPMYVIATLPGEASPEFLLMTPFTPRNKDNLIGLMMARCDGDKLGETQVLLLSKQEILLGPMQVEARINQDQNISKDLTLWNQQGSQVLRGQMSVLPIDDTFIYVEPIYIQAKEARMPQMKKVVVAAGNTLIYADTYDQALAQLGGLAQSAPPTAAPPPASAPVKTTTSLAPVPSATPDVRMQAVREHLRRYRELSSQGKWADAGKELEAIEGLVKQ